MDLATIRDAGQREARARLDQFAATGGPEAVAGAPCEPGGPGREKIAGKYCGWTQYERANGEEARAERILSGARLPDTTTGEVIEGIPMPWAARDALASVPPLHRIDLPGPRAATLAEARGVVSARASALRERLRELRDIVPATEHARFLTAVRQWLRQRGPRTPPAAFRMACTLPETPSPAEMTIIETPFRIPRYMDHPEWRPR